MESKKEIQVTGRNGTSPGTSSSGANNPLGDALETVLSFLSTKDLKACRQVSKDWNTEGCRALRRRTRVDLCLYLYGTGTGDKGKELRSLLEAGMKLGLPTPFQKISLAGSNISLWEHRALIHSLLSSKFSFSITDLSTWDLQGTTRRRVHKYALNLLSTVSPSLESLRFEVPQLGSWDKALHSKDRLHLSFPHLRSMSIVVKATTPFLGPAAAIINASSPNLSSLSITGHYPYRRGSVQELLQTSNLRGIRELRFEVLVSDLSVGEELWDEMLCFEGEGLETLDFCGYVSYEQVPKLWNFTRKFSPGLNSFVWRCNSMSITDWTVVPPCPKLDKLELMYAFVDNLFVRKFPTLSWLKCWDVSFSCQYCEHGIQSGHESLRVLECDHVSDVDEVMVRQVFPNAAVRHY